jgi:hypothetical protein
VNTISSSKKIQNIIVSTFAVLESDFPFKSPSESNFNEFTIYRNLTRNLYDVIQGQEPKASRIAGWALSKLTRNYGNSEEEDSLNFDYSSSSSFGQKDPPDYRRLHLSSSYLRSVYDLLCLSTHNMGTCEKILNLVLCKLDDPLPLVNWGKPLIPMLDDLTDRSESFMMTIFSFVSKNVSNTSSKSLVEIFTHFLQLKKIPSTLRPLYLSDMGAGKLLELGGLFDVHSTPSDNILQMALAPTKIIEILKGLVEGLFSTHERSPELQVIIIVIS